MGQQMLIEELLMFGNLTGLTSQIMSCVFTVALRDKKPNYIVAQT